MARLASLASLLPSRARRVHLRLAVSLAVLLLLPGVLLADYKDQIGYTQLADELGANVPTGSGIWACQVEAGTGAYVPDSESFPDKSFHLKSGASEPFAHATTVGSYYYGANSIAPGITDVDCWRASHWVGPGFLKTSSDSEPIVETCRVQNHSWIGSSVDAREELRRFDYAIDRDGFMAVVGVNNGSGTFIPQLMPHSYNSIAVGLTNGNHSRGLTTFDQAGRVKPEIVAPLSYTSYASPVVSAAAALLLETADGDEALADARHNSEVTKAILLAGATKEEFGDWDRTVTRPLDKVYGAGELNIYSSFHILTAGRQPPGQANPAGTSAWDFAGISTDEQTSLYFLEVPEGHVLRELSAILTWNRIVESGHPSKVLWGDPTAEVANLDMRLYTLSGFGSGEHLDASESPVDNIEHIYWPMNLAAGWYILEVEADFTDTNLSEVDYAVAWRGDVGVLGQADADLNGDGFVGQTDIDFVLAFWGQNVAPGDPLSGDPSGDGFVGQTDLDIVLSYWGQSVPPPLEATWTPSDPAAAAAVPEPSTLALLALAGLALAPRRARACGHA